MILRVILSALFIAASLDSTAAPRELNNIAANINSYKNQRVTMILRLKNIDLIFEKIVFYDIKNVDVSFDFSGDKKKPLSSYFLNAHQGLQYRVIFKVTGKGSLGLIHGDLISFKPIVLDKIIP
jgi:hypothetical protein